MKAVILAGGEGTRLRPLTLKVPKPVVPIVNVPFLRYQLELLKKYNVDETILSVGYQPEKIESVLGQSNKLHYIVENVPLGTAGAYKNAESFLDGSTLVFNGDILCNFDLNKIIRFHQANSAIATIVLTQVGNPSSYGLVETTEDGRVTRFLEKPGLEDITCNTINAGCYVLEPEVLEMIPLGKNYSFEKSVFPDLLASGRAVYGYVAPGYWIDIGTPEKYLNAHLDILQRRFVPSVILPWEDSMPKLKPGAKFLNSFISSSCAIGEKSQIFSSSINEGCRIGKRVIIDRSVIWSGVEIGDDTKIEGCVVGNSCQIGKNAVLSKTILGDNTVVLDNSQLEMSSK